MLKIIQYFLGVKESINFCKSIELPVYLTIECFCCLVSRAVHLIALRLDPHHHFFLC